ncbi:putative toxin-antitoxin system toxin component, PIN family [bacterium]|nr:MAG: putative toxin-antitoxin system toxin component, PIN family [bacterium]
MRVFLDTNVLVSAFTTRGISSEIFESIIQFHEFIISTDVLLELSRILDTKFHVPTEEIHELTSYLSTFEIVHFSADKTLYTIRDPNDNAILHAAIQAKADIFITGDNDLLSMASLVKELSILSPKTTWYIFKSTP